MTKTRMTRGKFAGINACADARGVIAALAMDQRGSLQKMLAAASPAGATVTNEDLVRFKTAVTDALSPHASAILLDPEYGLPALKTKARQTGLLLAYEKSGYDTTARGRLPDLIPEWSVRRLAEAGADAIKLLAHYDPDDAPALNTVKQAFIERVGAECAAVDRPLFLEIVGYQDGLDEKGLEFARRKPDKVARYMAEFSRPRYGVDVLKVEVPVNMKFVAGTAAFGGTAAYSRAEALVHFREAASVATTPFIYLSAGVSDAVFRETLELAIEAGTTFSGVLCGRATWQDGVPAYANQGYAALRAWLADRGAANIAALNDLLARGAAPWWSAYGGLEMIEVV
ncbi:MAG: tagatose 1,6-diphosphate aldolase [Chloroflexota bacterium]|nr:tagatose 1,6-diphosphate aldolase [Chloroflexota bacterium]